MNEDPRTLISEQGEDMACEYPEPDMTVLYPYHGDMTKTDQGVKCIGYGTFSHQRHTDLSMGSKNPQYEIAHQPGSSPTNCGRRSGAHKISLNRGKTGQPRARSPPVPLHYCNVYHILLVQWLSYC